MDGEETGDAPIFWDALSFSAGRARSRTPAATRHHFIIGAQKNTVFGPVYAEEQKHRVRTSQNFEGEARIPSPDAASLQHSYSQARSLEVPAQHTYDRRLGLGGRIIRTSRMVHERLESRARRGRCRTRHFEVSSRFVLRVVLVEVKMPKERRTAGGRQET